MAESLDFSSEDFEFVIDRVLYSPLVYLAFASSTRKGKDDEKLDFKMLLLFNVLNLGFVRLDSPYRRMNLGGV
jgi:hypothetical protein